MNISTREKVLLIIMGTVLALFFSYTFLIKPIMDNIVLTETDIIAAQAQKDNLDIAAANKKALEEKNAELDKQIQKTLKIFYPRLETKATYKFIDDSVKTSGLTPAGLSLTSSSLSYPDTFGGVAEGAEEYPFYDMAQQIAGGHLQLSEQVGDVQQSDSAEPILTECREAQISYSGTVEGLRAFLAILESQNKSIVVSSFNFEQGEQFDGSINFTMYAVPKPFADNEGLPEYK